MTLAALRTWNVHLTATVPPVSESSLHLLSQCPATTRFMQVQLLLVDLPKSSISDTRVDYRKQVVRYSQGLPAGERQ